MAKKARVKEVYAETYPKESNPLNAHLTASLLEAGKAAGYVQRAGSLSDGRSFAQVYIIIEKDAGPVTDQ